MLETKQIFYRIDRKRISYLRFILEAYDGIAVVSTVDAKEGLIKIAIAPGCESVVEALFNDLKQKFILRKVGKVISRS